MTTNAAAPPQPLEFWFEFGSTYSYPALMRIGALAAEYAVPVVWKPFLLGPIFKSFGWDSSPFVLQPQKGAYTWRDMQRLCEKYALPWKQPTAFPRSALLPMRVALLGAQQPWFAAYAGRIMQLNFAEDRDIDNEAAVSEVLLALGLPVDELIAAARSGEAKSRLRRQTEEAARRGIFGAPTFFVGSEMFWGNDRLEDALLFAAGRR
ncbi:MAG TPA: 2-hydroxychromene-2-carboxylate isomerase [Janthinobacterium sp.]|jgi:2-hydroxychromene-2-carboxylate isomerase|nr:2-hydroxychromene-2-carboxylate isomerase [Janthinobacterium sp.]